MGPTSEVTEAATRSLAQGGTTASTYMYRVRRWVATPPSSDPEGFAFAGSPMSLGVPTVSAKPAAGISAVVRSTARRVVDDARPEARVARDDTGAPPAATAVSWADDAAAIWSLSRRRSR